MFHIASAIFISFTAKNHFRSQVRTFRSVISPPLCLLFPCGVSAWSVEQKDRAAPVKQRLRFVNPGAGIPERGQKYLTMKIRHVVVQSADCRHLGSSSCTMAICKSASAARSILEDLASEKWELQVTEELVSLG